MDDYYLLLNQLWMGTLDQAPTQDRTGVGTVRRFAPDPLRFDLSEGFPLLTGKSTHWKSVLGELLWFVSGDTNARRLREDYGVTIWDEWAHAETGDLGPVYGAQWRKWYGQDGTAHDQLANLVEGLKRDPYSRRHLVSAWNVGDLSSMALPPCHYSFQCSVSEGELSMLVNMRSCDVFLGLPFNIASYAALAHMLSSLTDLEPGHLTLMLGDAHLYLNHVEQAGELLDRFSPSQIPELPELRVDPSVQSIDDFTVDSFELIGYNPLPKIAAPVAV